MRDHFNTHECHGRERGRGETNTMDWQALRYARMRRTMEDGMSERHGREHGRGRAHGGFGKFGGRGFGHGHPFGGRERGFGGHGFGGRGFGGGDFGGGREGGRMFGGGDLRFVVLQLLSERPSHGYELIKAIGERMGGQYQPSPGVVYPMLTMLEEMGHATVTAEGTRKLYAITDEGRKALDENRAVVEALFARMDRVREAQTGGPAQQIERAVMNLRMALRMKQQGQLTTEQIHALTDILDAAAKQIERL